MFAQLRSRQFSFTFIAVLLALSTLLLITSLTFAKPAGTIIVNPGDSIQAAIDSATPGDTIVINAGTYTESLTLSKAVSLTGVNSTTVVIHAVSNQRVLTVTGSVINNSVVISGLVFSGGNIVAYSPETSKGGGLYFTDSAQPSLYNVVIADNIAQSGGGIYADTGSSLNLHHVRIEGNVATNIGGGAMAPVTVTLEDCMFVNNHGDWSGGMYGSAVTVTNTEFISNSARTGSGGLLIMPNSGISYSSVTGGKFERNDPEGLVAYGVLTISGTHFISNTGGGASCGPCFVMNGWFERNTGTALGGGSVVLTDSVFLQNTGGAIDAITATINGGAFVQNAGGFMGVLTVGTLDVSGTQFISNTGNSGGAVATLFAARISGARFEGNQGTYGGGLYAKYALALTDTIFVNNSATYGGGVYHSYFYDDNFGDVNDDARIVNTLFAHNTASSKGAALYLSAVGKVDILHTTIADAAPNSRAALIVSGTVGITNTIIANHAVGIERIGGTVYEDYNLFYGNTADLSGTISGGTHDVFGNPNFVDPANGDYHVAPPSAAIDAGTDAGVYTDLDGNVRPSGGGFDIGAYEVSIATVPITGLVAINDSPTRIDTATTLTATVEAGDLVTYRWDFGDGSAPGNRQAVTHTYPTAGIYTAIVTASNSLNTVTATTTVTVYVTPIASLTAANSSPTVFGQATVFTASISAGDRVSYTWNFGDGLSTGTGITSTHTYSTVGTYTATVTAANSVNVVSATTRVTITGVPLFSEVGTPLVGVYDSSVAWGDYDNDGWLDILLTGYASGSPIAALYHNNGDGTFTDIGAGLMGVVQSSVAWGDYDNDGWLDILLTGYTGATFIAKVYHNNSNNTFTDIGAGLPGIEGGAVAWGDYDNDGRLDILLTGRMAGYTSIAKVYHNNWDDTFTDIGAGLAGVYESSVAWGDYDNDGRLDILLTGYTPSWTPVFNIYHNNGDGTFTDIGAGLPEAGGGSVAWGDYDNDGWLDILLTGGTADHTYIAKVYHNNGNGTFTDIGAGLAGAVSWGPSVAWGDYDNDGWLDILLAGDTGWTAIATVYHNNSDGTFTDIGAGLAGVSFGSVAWGDYDNDGRLDILVTGDTGDIWDTIPIAKVYHNNIPTTNSLPAAPTGLGAAVTGTTVNLIWDAAADNQTPAAGLTYNLRVGTAPGGMQIAAPMADTATGFRRVPQIGNANLGLTATLNFTTSGTYYWSVQAIDTVWAGSAFAAEGSFYIAGVVINGPTTGVINTAYTFTATVNSPTTLPFTYTWQASGQSPVTHSAVSSLTDTVTFTWPSGVSGAQAITVTAVNSVSVVSATTRVAITDVPLSGLSASNNSPTAFGGATTLSATVSAGSNVTYTWNFGDGSSIGMGITSTHTYSTVGVYAATVTAVNSVSVVSATTRVTITDVPLSDLSAINSGPTAIGGVTTLTATISAGSNVTYTWNFGDGAPVAFGQVVAHIYPFSTTFRFTATVTAANSINTQTATTTVIIIPKRVYLPLLIK
jgi:PKD repeat protein